MAAMHAWPVATNKSQSRESATNVPVVNSAHPAPPCFVMDAKLGSTAQWAVQAVRAVHAQPVTTEVLVNRSALNARVESIKTNQPQLPAKAAGVKY